ncbi:hypothetical protein ONS95_005192 [Cadophora gregata]|uniref:uncharacterized protein n=1 Tax=Cadophora gregata TaxID=51156 RepID=UPI0026DCD49E|nr:uncharacterized protein ONS95_005192 [Cadophora gregata]KAK0104930.1 hypothetical protein ONS95_005192 [Cadophora gregata]KAK0114989.1 hypothetical protein ONS96_013463 [Cadophora gregata f. sp. sojae]
MGGSAFTNLYTPRMPPQIYNLILSQTLSTVQKHFTNVSSPISAPGKLDYGDVDILCFGPLTPSYNPAATPNATVTETIAKELGAKAWIVGKNGQAMNLAIPWPQDDDSSEISFEKGGEEEQATKDEDDQKEKFIQLDIHILPTLSSYNWELFHSAHGDLWNILGSTIRRFGLTVNNLGLFLRIPEIELQDRKKSMVFLTGEPNTILEFLRLDSARWWKSFESQDEMFGYAAGCRMFWVKEKLEVGEAEGDVVGEIPAEISVESPQNGDSNGSVIEGQEGGKAGKKKLKHNDRQRLEKRPIFRSWIEDFIPKCRDQGLYLAEQTSREQIRDEAFEKFGVKDEYESRLKEWNLEKHKDELWRGVIKASVPVEGVDPQFRAASVKYLKGVIMEGGIWEGKTVKASERDEDGRWDFEEVKKFVVGNWEEAGRLGMEIQQKKAVENMKARDEKKAKLAGLEGQEKEKTDWQVEERVIA